jgi:hypothetical protein
MDPSMKAKGHIHNYVAVYEKLWKSYIIMDPSMKAKGHIHNYVAVYEKLWKTYIIMEPFMRSCYTCGTRT